MGKTTARSTVDESVDESTSEHARAQGCPPAPTTSDEARVFYDEMWRNYGHLEDVNPAAFHRRRVVRRLVGQYAPRARQVLDVGCGQGQLLREIAPQLAGASFAGADVSEESLLVSRQKNPTYDLFAMDLVDPKFESQHKARLGAFELVTCSEVLEHIPNDRLAAERLASLVCKGGHLVVTVPGGTPSQFDRLIGHQRHYTKQQLKTLLQTTGLEVCEILAWGMPFHTLYRTAVRVASRSMRPGTHQGDVARASRTSAVLGSAYTLASRLMHPLFYLNADFGGEQMIAVATKR